MTPNPEKSILRRALLHRIGEALLAIIIIVGIWYFWRFIQTERVNLQQKRQLLEKGPNQQVTQQQLKETLQKHDHDLQRVKALLLPKESIGDFVSVLEQKGKLSQVQLEVPLIAEDQKFDENHQPIPQTGPYVDVRLEVVAAGDPPQLVQLMHRIENLPYIVRVLSWDIHTLKPGEVPTLAVVAPATGPMGGVVTPTSTPKTTGQLKATLLLTMQQEPRHE